MENKHPILNIQEQKKDFNSSLEKAIKSLNWPFLFEEDAKIISDVLLDADFDISYINKELIARLKDVENKKEKSEKILILLISEILYPVATCGYLAENKKGVPLSKIPLIEYDSPGYTSKETPLYLRKGLQSNLVTTLFTLQQAGNLELDDDAIQKINLFLKTRKMSAGQEMEISNEAIMLETQLALERKFFQLLQAGRIKLEEL